MSVCTGQDKELLGELFLQLICEPGFPEEKAHLSSFIPTTNSTLRCFGEEWLRGSDKKQLEVSSLLVFSSSPPKRTQLPGGHVLPCRRALSGYLVHGNPRPCNGSLSPSSSLRSIFSCLSCPRAVSNAQGCTGIFSGVFRWSSEELL